MLDYSICMGLGCEWYAGFPDMPSYPTRTTPKHVCRKVLGEIGNIDDYPTEDEANVPVECPFVLEYALLREKENE